MRLCCIVVLVVAPCSSALAQEPPAYSQKRLIISDRAIALGLEKQAPPKPATSRDSNKNGALIGGVIGAVALGVWGASFCRSFDIFYDDDSGCWKADVTSAAIGFGLGAAAGAGIDALLIRDQRRLIPTR